MCCQAILRCEKQPDATIAAKRIDGRALRALRMHVSSFLFHSLAGTHIVAH
jgi:hypothetical protein